MSNGDPGKVMLSAVSAAAFGLAVWVLTGSMDASVYVSVGVLSGLLALT